jgi:hypothetical protein
MNQRRSGISSIWQPARGRHRATIVEARRHRTGLPRRSQWLPELAASRERLVGSAVKAAVSSS